MNEISFETLLDLADGRLTLAAAAEVEQKLATADADTLATLAWLRRFRQLGDEVTLASPPASLRRELNRRFADARQGPGLLQQLRAALSFDSYQQPALAGVRGSADAEGRQLIYTSERVDVALNLRPRPQPEQVDLFGQVLPNDADESAVYTVQLLQNDRQQAIANTDEFGEFLFPSLTPAVYDLVLSSDTAEVYFPPVDLRYGPSARASARG